MTGVIRKAEGGRWKKGVVSIESIHHLEVRVPESPSSFVQNSRLRRACSALRRQGIRQVAVPPPWREAFPWERWGLRPLTRRPFIRAMAGELTVASAGYFQEAAGALLFAGACDADVLRAARLLSRVFPRIGICLSTGGERLRRELMGESGVAPLLGAFDSFPSIALCFAPVPPERRKKLRALAFVDASEEGVFLPGVPRLMDFRLKPHDDLWGTDQAALAGSLLRERPGFRKNLAIESLAFDFETS